LLHTAARRKEKEGKIRYRINKTAKMIPDQRKILLANRKLEDDRKELEELRKELEEKGRHSNSAKSRLKEIERLSIETAEILKRR
jgi:hypothetical protein